MVESIQSTNRDTLVWPLSSVQDESVLPSLQKTKELIPANFPSIKRPPPLSPCEIKNSKGERSSFLLTSHIKRSLLTPDILLVPALFLESSNLAPVLKVPVTPHPTISATLFNSFFSKYNAGYLMGILISSESCPRAISLCPTLSISNCFCINIFDIM